MPKAKAPHVKTNEPLTIRLGDELSKDLAEAVSTTKLSRSDVARLAIERGLKIVVAQLTSPVSQAA